MSSSSSRNFKRARTMALVLLFFLGLSALPAGILMIVDPMQGGMGIPLYLLEHTPFDDFLIPGIILGLFNGLLSLVIAILVIRKHPYQAWFIMFQGAVLFIWLATEVFMGIFYALLTIPYAVVAILLICSALLMKLSKTGLS